MNIRAATIADAEAISALIMDLSDPFYTSPTREGAEPFLASVSTEAQRGYIAAGNFSYHVAESDGGLVAVVALRDNSHLFHLFVAKPLQGTGLARRLWNIVKNNAMAAGNRGQFTVNSSLNAVPIYEKFGFVRKGEVQYIHGISCQPMQLQCR
ncbi:MAG: GNAT family N-acetyltransferase [Candidatus Competibacter sp.]|nr:GNAT family N-acetyltransferase [Candidatus Competibacter sp.]MDG4583002.1 GNAT family N-acetyltransferase [Candidatus Competibacter sp.]